MTIPISVFFEILGLVIGFFFIWVTVSNRITAVEAKMEERKETNDRHLSKFEDKIDTIQETLTDFLVKLEGKQNK